MDVIGYGLGRMLKTIRKLFCLFGKHDWSYYIQKDDSIGRTCEVCGKIESNKRLWLSKIYTGFE
jgi:hypothetical protein